MSEKPPTAEKLCEYLTPGQHRRVQMANRFGEQLSRLLAVLQTEDHGLGEFNPKVDVDVRGCLERLQLHQDLLSRCEEYEVQVAVEFTIQAEDYVSSRRLVAFLDCDRRSEIGHHAYLLRCWIGVCMDWLIVAARQRGIMIEGNQIDERAKRQLWFATEPAPNAPPPTHPPPDTAFRPPAAIEEGGGNPVTPPTAGRPTPPSKSKDAMRREALYECIRALRRSGMTVTSIVAHLSTPEGKDLSAEVRWELMQRPNTTRGGNSRARVPADVVAAALRSLYTKPQDG